MRITMMAYFHRYTFEGPDLIITNVGPDDEGVYTCEIITKLDMASANGTLTLCGKITDHILYDQKPASVKKIFRQAVYRWLW